jgi:hypothetical protein
MKYFYVLMFTIGLILQDLPGFAAFRLAEDFSTEAGASCKIDYTLQGNDDSKPEPCKVKLQVKELDCNTASTGAIGVEHISGKGPFRYEWSNGATTKDIYNVKPGSYTVKVTDANGSTDLKRVTLKAPLELKLTTEVKNVSQKGGRDGSILIKGINSSYAVKCFGPKGQRFIQQTELHDLIEGEYIIMVSDRQSCTTVSKVIISASGALQNR